MIDLVCEKSGVFFDEWNTLLVQLGHWDYIFSETSYNMPSCQHEWVRIASACTIGLATDYFRRVLGPCRSSPMIIAWLAHRPAASPCENRKAAACDMLRESQEPDADPTIRKFCITFHRELMAASESGMVPAYVFDMVRDLDCMWICHTQDIEGANNQVKTIGTISPAIKWELLSSRMTVKRMLGPPCSVSVEERRAVCDRVIDACVGMHKETLDMARVGKGRWEAVDVAASPDLYPPPPPAESGVGRHIANVRRTRHDLCAARMLAKLKSVLGPDTKVHNLVNNVAFNLAFAECSGDTGRSRSYIPSLSHRSVLWCVEASDIQSDIQSCDAADSHPNLGFVEAILPLRPRPLLYVLADAHHEAVQLGPDGDFHLRMLRLVWARGNLTSAYVTDADHLFCMTEAGDSIPFPQCCIA